jgi:MoaA/NifB/PqqE/SkfB family radical SAM enzyme
MCSYRDPLPNELTLDEIRQLAEQLSALGLRHIVYSGGEPLTRRDFPEICSAFGALNVKQSMLTNGLLLHKRFPEIQPYLSDVIVSLDGPNATIHNAIRGLDAFDQIVKGIRAVVSAIPRPKVSIRTVIQRKNFREMSQMVTFAKSLGVDRISFLAVDVSSRAFHRPQEGLPYEREAILLNAEEAQELRGLMKDFATAHEREISIKFVSESMEKLFHMVEYFEALANLAPYPRNHCNAPMVSTVITSTGDLLPCYFLPSFGNVKRAFLKSLLNLSSARETRKNVRAYDLEQCHKCTCTLHISPLSALASRF